MDASVELIAAAFDRLRATAAVTNIVGTRIHSRVPEDRDGRPNVAFPYISLGPSSSIPADFDCLDGEEITIQIDCWSSGSGEAYGSAECRKLADAVKRALHHAELALTDNALVTLEWELTRVMQDPDPAIHHGAVQFTALIETP